MGAFHSASYLVAASMKTIFKLFIVVVVLLAIVAGYFFVQQGELDTKVSHNHQDEIITVAKGDSLDETLRRLEKLGIIRSATAVRLYIKLTGRNTILKAGDYRFPSPLTAKEALATLESGGIQPIS